MRPTSARSSANEHVVAFFPTDPATLGHTMVIPREHIPDIWSLDEERAGELARATLRVANAVRAATGPEGLSIIQSNGEVASQSVFHLHVHVVPRWGGDGLGPIWPSETDFSEQAKNDTLARVRAAFEKPGASHD